MEVDWESVIFYLVCLSYPHITEGLITAQQTAETPHERGGRVQSGETEGKQKAASKPSFIHIATGYQD